jgi:GNAT superfamily N-acetyltransferase
VCVLPRADDRNVQQNGALAMNESIRLIDVADTDIRDAIVGPLAAYNAERAGSGDHRPLVLVLEDADGQVAGGLWGRTAYAWLFVEFLFVPPELRGNGIGADLISRAEREAVSRGCHSAWLDTFEFQARGFYERHGYSVFGQLSDYPPGFSRYFLKKVLVS